MTQNIFKLAESPLYISSANSSGQSLKDFQITTDVASKKDYFDSFAIKTLEYVPNAKNILDIACNDGTQLDSYQKFLSL